MRSALGLAVLLGVSIAIWLWWSATDTPPPDTAPATTEATTTAPRSDTAAAESLSRSATSDSATARCALHVVLLPHRGSPEKANLAWASHVDPLRVESFVPDTQVPDSPAPITGFVQVDGEASLEVPAGRWLALDAVSLLDPRRNTSIRLPPLTGSQRVVLDLSPSTWTLAVQLWTADLDGPAASRPVRLRIAPLGGDGQESERTIRTDATGRAVFQSVAPGALLVLAPDAAPEDHWPAALRLIANPAEPPRLLRCDLVEKPVRHRVSIGVVADAAVVAEPAKLFLRRVDGAGELYPQTLALSANRVEDHVEVPAGEYELGIVPFGNGRPEPSSLRVRGAMQVEVRVAATARRTIALEGLARLDFPIGVAPLVADDLPGLDTRLVFCGPYRWGSASATIGALPAGTRLLATARNAAYLSTRDVPESGDAALTMQAATLLHIEWLHGPLGAGGRALVHVRNGDHESMRMLSHALVRRGAIQAPACTAVVPVPRGAVEIECLAGDGATLWRRSVVADGPHLYVPVRTD